MHDIFVSGVSTRRERSRHRRSKKLSQLGWVVTLALGAAIAIGTAVVGAMTVSA